MEPTNLKNIIIGAIILIVVIAIIRFIAKSLGRLIVLLGIIAVAAYFLFFYEGGLLDWGNDRFIMDELHEKHCIRKENPKMCDYIIAPIHKDIHSQYSKQEIAELQSNKLKSLKIIVTSIAKNRAVIYARLKKDKQTHLWDDFIKEVRGKDVEKQFSKQLDKMATQ